MIQVQLLTMTGCACSLGNVIALSYGYPKIGLALGFIGAFYLIKAIRMLKKEKK